MEEFEDFKNQKAENMKMSVIEMLDKAKPIKKLQTIWESLDGSQRSDKDIWYYIWEVNSSGKALKPSEKYYPTLAKAKCYDDIDVLGWGSKIRQIL